jgi:hypothetical protein
MLFFYFYWLVFNLLCNTLMIVLVLIFSKWKSIINQLLQSTKKLLYMTKDKFKTHFGF